MNPDEVLKLAPLVEDPLDHRDWCKPWNDEETCHPQLRCSLRSYALPALKQVYGTCAPHAALQLAWSITRQTPGLRGIKISPMDLYWRARERMGTLPDDSGCTMRAVMHALTNPGVVPWFKYPDEPDYKKRPPSDNCPRFKIPGYVTIPAGESAPHAVRHAIFEQRLPVMVGLKIPEDRMLKFAREFALYSPDLDYDGPTYGHCMLIDGWDGYDSFEVLNSWGPGWGVGGGGMVHADYLKSAKTCTGLWTVCMDPEDAIIPEDNA